jgi:hypothetical protein
VVVLRNTSHTLPPARDQNNIFALRDMPHAQICTDGRKSMKPSDLVIATHPLRCGSAFAISIGARDRFTDLGRGFSSRDEEGDRMTCYVERRGGFVRYEVRERGIGDGWELFPSEHREEEDTNSSYEQLLQNASSIDVWPSDRRGIRS